MRQAVTIEQTNKHWKALRMSGWLVALGGAALAAMASGSGSAAAGLIAWTVVPLGVGMVMWAGFMAWWHHG